MLRRAAVCRCCPSVCACVEGLTCEKLSCADGQLCVMNEATSTPVCVDCSRPCFSTTLPGVGTRYQLCASDGRTYTDWCSVVRETCSSRRLVETRHFGPCRGQCVHTHTPSFSGPLSRTTRMSWYQRGETNLDFTEARDSESQWHQLGHLQVCTSLQTDNHASTPSCRPINSVKALKAGVKLGDPSGSQIRHLLFEIHYL